MLKVTNKYTIVTIVKWDIYQAIFDEIAKNRPIDRPIDVHYREGKKLRRGEGNGPHPLNSDFCLTEDMKQWAKNNGYGCLDLGHITEKFISYYKANGQKFASWDAKWRGWVIREEKICGPTKPATDLDDEYPLVKGGESQ